MPIIWYISTITYLNNPKWKKIEMYIRPQRNRNLYSATLQIQVFAILYALLLITCNPNLTSGTRENKKGPCDYQLNSLLKRSRKELTTRLHSRWWANLRTHGFRKKMNWLRICTYTTRNKTDFTNLWTNSWERWTRRMLPVLLPAKDVGICWHHIFGLKGAQSVRSAQMILHCLKEYLPAILHIEFHHQ